MSRYTTRALPRNGTPTKAEHDAHVDETGRPWTQDPRPIRADVLTGRTRAIDTSPEKEGEQP